MLKKVEVKVSGDSSYLPGEVIDRIKFDNTNEKLVAEGKTPAVGERVLMGITKASLQTESFISAASFQETTRVLTDASVKTLVVSWNEAAEINDSVCKEALVIPINTRSPTAGVLPSATNFSLVLSNFILSITSPGK